MAPARDLEDIGWGWLERESPVMSGMLCFKEHGKFGLKSFPSQD